MFFYTDQKLAWLSVPKCASSSLLEIFEKQLGWKKQDLRSPTVALDNLEFFGCLRDPDERHTSAIAEYLFQRNSTGLLTDYPEVLAGGIFDHHAWTLGMSFPQAILDRTTFFIMDDPQGLWPNHLVSWLSNRGVDLPGPVPHLNAIQDKDPTLKQRIIDVKVEYAIEHRWLTNWVLAPDYEIYNKHLAVQHELADR